MKDYLDRSVLVLIYDISFAFDGVLYLPVLDELYADSNHGECCGEFWPGFVAVARR